MNFKTDKFRIGTVTHLKATKNGVVAIAYIYALPVQ